MDWSALDTLCKVIYCCVNSVTELLFDTKMLQSILMSTNVPESLCSCCSALLLLNLSIRLVTSQTLCKVMLCHTKMLLSSLASSNVLLLLLLCFITIELVDLLVAPVALPFDLVGAPRFFCLACSVAGLPNEDTPIHFNWPVQKKSDWERSQYLSLLLGGKSQVKCPACSAVRVVFPISFASFDETINSTPCPLWWNHW